MSSERKREALGKKRREKSDRARKMQTHDLREHPLQEHLHDDRRIWEDSLNDLGFLGDGDSNFLVESSERRFGFGSRLHWVGKGLPAERDVENARVKGISDGLGSQRVEIGG